jgi:hypothetical protein
MSMPSSPPLQRLASLVIKDGVALGGLSSEDRSLALALVWTALPATPCSEREVNERLREQLAGPTRCLGTDHVELRRWLVDGGWLQRDGFGREYRRVDAGAMPVEQQALANALAPLDATAWVRAQRSELAERRAARRRAWQAGPEA